LIILSARAAVVTSINAIRYGGIYDLAVQPDGKILASGNDSSNTDGNTAVVRYLANGALDPSFGTSGIAITRVGSGFSTGENVNIQSNGKIVVTGNSYSGSHNDFGAVRFNADGTIDTSFGTSGKVITAIGTREDNVRDAAIQTDGKIVVIGHSENASAGFQEDFAVVRYVGDPLIGFRAPFDFDGDNKTDLAIFRPAPGQWWYQRSSNGGNFAASFGASSDKIVPADYTGDGKADFAFFRPASGQWFILRSEDFSFYAFPFGTSTDTPVPADYDGDGKADAAVFRSSTQTWYINKSSGGTEITAFGAAGDKATPADYDGDGKTDIAIFRPSGASGAEWWIRRSLNQSVFALQFGISSDKPVQGDYTGDGRADIAFFRPTNGSWFILRSEDFSFYSFPFGTSGDAPVAGDYDGDGRADAGVFRPSSNTWFVQRSSAGTFIQSFGISGDLPLPNAFVP
jgi:uncharacterized delta-60 repeat protein